MIVETSPLLEPPEHPSQVVLGNRTLDVYATPEEVAPYIQALAAKIILADFAAVLVNVKGGWWLARELARLQNFSGPFQEIEYHRPANGIGVELVKSVPQELANEPVLVVDDILDRGDTLMGIYQDAPWATFVVAVHKFGIPNQIWPPRVNIGFSVRNRWLGSLGMNLDHEGSEQEIRNYSGLVFIPTA